MFFIGLTRAPCEDVSCWASSFAPLFSIALVAVLISTVQFRHDLSLNTWPHRLFFKRGSTERATAGFIWQSSRFPGGPEHKEFRFRGKCPSRLGQGHFQLACRVSAHCHADQELHYGPDAWHISLAFIGRTSWINKGFPSISGIDPWFINSWWAVLYKLHMWGIHRGYRNGV